jgi:hypothetical protein
MEQLQRLHETQIVSFRVSTDGRFVCVDNPQSFHMEQLTLQEMEQLISELTELKKGLK